MGCKRNTSYNIRQLVILHNAKGESYRKVAAMLKFSKSTVGDIIKRFKYEDQIESILQRDQQKILDTQDKRKIIRKIKKDPTSSASKLAAKLLEETGKKVHPQTIRRALKECGYNGRVARKNLMRVNSTFLDRMGEEWCGKRKMKNSKLKIQSRL